MSKKPKSKSSNKPGKKLGSTVPDRKTVDSVLPQCPHCGAVTEPKNLRYRREVEGNGEHNGRPYGKVILWSANCGACGAAITVRRHEFIPAAS